MRWESPSRPLVVYPPPSIKFNFFSEPIFLFLDRYDKANDILNILKLWRDWLSYYKDRRSRMAEPRPKHQIEPRSHPIYRILLDLECTLLAGRSYQAIRLRITTMSAIDFRCAPSLSLDSRGPDNIILCQI
ncbi:hypothetical protein PGTUg99_032909 [Puccinia graminis f. sp. tritici]|uniref:Uncharacterized protein n=1 Tax=Puccinia graminis f. sp. tritici TaxID=56615 RepID=A0A5B0MFC1_PUCGR|nr:hypothetical protein PGTUg99_032909 [Puccinia graminis f. sp. tritici]